MADENTNEGAKPPTPKPQARNAEPKIEFKVEIADDHNNNVAPTLVTSILLRGRWAINNTRGMTIDGEHPLRSMPDIPGIYVQLSSAKRRGRIYDPLAYPENEEHMEHVQKILEKANGEKQGPLKEMIFDNLEDDDLKTWSYWIRVLLDSRQVVVISGEVPSIQDIKKMPGKIILTNQFDRDTDEQKVMDVPKRYRPPFELAPGEKTKQREIVQV